MKKIKIDEVYKICACKRNEIRHKHYEDRILNILEQLILICFDNRTEPDTLPQIFLLNKIQLYSNEIKTFLEDLLKINVKVEVIKSDYVYGNNIKISLEE